MMPPPFTASPPPNWSLLLLLALAHSKALPQHTNTVEKSNQAKKRKRKKRYFLHFIEGKGEEMQWEIQVSKQGKGKIRAEGKKKELRGKKASKQLSPNGTSLQSSSSALAVTSPIYPTDLLLINSFTDHSLVNWCGSGRKPEVSMCRFYKPRESWYLFGLW